MRGTSRISCPATVLAVFFAISGPGATTSTSAQEAAQVADALRLYEAKRWSRAYRALVPVAKAGHPRAMLLVGEMLLFGHGTTSDIDEGLMWLERAADDGLAREATYLAGRFLARWKHDWTRAAPYVSRAAALGHPEAQAMLANMYAMGRGVARNPAEAERLRRQAADTTEDTWTVWLAARSYLDGGRDGGSRDTGRGIELLRKAAEKGHALAQDDLGAIYLEGALVPVDLREAQRWLEAASRNGVATAHMRLAKLYLAKGQPNNALSCWIDAWKGARDTDNERLLKEVYVWYFALGLIGHATGPTDVLKNDKSPKGVCRSEPMEFVSLLIAQYIEDAGFGRKRKP
jgi:TPR repeat protein